MQFDLSFPVTIALYIAVFLLVLVGLIHSILGERYILIRLFRRGDLPTLFGGTEFTRRTLRFAWHITTVAWWGIAAILFLLAQGAISQHNIALVIGTTSCATALIIFTVSRSTHLAWIVFLIVGCIALYASVSGV